MSLDKVFSATTASNLPIVSSREHIEEGRLSISSREFAHRLTASYLHNVELAGQEPKISATHWIELLTLWLSGESHPLFPLPISKEDLHKLLTVLEDYKQQLLSKGSYREKAKNILEEVQETLKRQSFCYVALGYRGGMGHGGHAVTLKIIDRGGQVEALFLNLGEGAQLHPIVDWEASGSRHSFHSFLVIIDKKVLFSDKGKKAFSHLFRLQDERCPPRTHYHEAVDIYIPIYSLGKLQGSFFRDIVERSRKPQLTNICGDMAITLVVKDYLIDLGYTREQIHRLITIEKLTNIVTLYQQLHRPKGYDEGSELDNWKMLAAGIKEFSSRGDKDYGTQLTQQESEQVVHLLQPIEAEVKKKIPQLETFSAPPIPLIISAENATTHIGSNESVPQHGSISFSAPDGKPRITSIPFVPIGKVEPQTIKQTIQFWFNYARTLLDHSIKIEALEREVRDFLYRAMCTLPIPDAVEAGFWDQVPEQDITPIITALTKMARYGVKRELAEGELTYRNALFLSISYAIVDKLVRRKFPEYFKEFASPFFPSRFKLEHYDYHGKEQYCRRDVKEKFFDFWFLPLEPTNRCWEQIRAYFEKQQHIKSYTLFALDAPEKIDICQELIQASLQTDYYRFWSSAMQHLKFLEPFMEKAFPKDRISSATPSQEEQLMRVWLNEKYQYIPEEIQCLYYFAYYTWYAFECDFPDHFLIDISESGGSSLRIKKLKKVTGSDQESLGAKFPLKIDKVAENEIHCLKKEDLYTPWNTELLRQWTRIFSASTLQIPELIQWIRTHRPHLDRQEFQTLILGALFKSGLLSRQIHEEATLFYQLREEFFDAARHYAQSPQQIGATLFLCRVGVALETYVAPPSQQCLLQYETLLLDMIKKVADPTSAYAHLLFLYQVDLPRKEHSARELIKARMWNLYHEYEPEEVPLWLAAEITSPLQQHREFLKLCFSNTAWVEQSAREIFSSLLENTQYPDPDIPVQGKYPIIEKGDYTIDLEGGGVFHLERQLVYIPKKQHPAEWVFYETKGLLWHEPGKSLWEAKTERIVKSIWEEGKFQLERQFPTLPKGFQEDWYHKAEVKPELFSGLLLASKDYFDHYMMSNVLIICKKYYGTPLYLALKGKKGYVINKLGKDGNCDLELVNILNTDHPLRSLFGRLGNLKEVCLWRHQDTGRLEEIEFIALGLSFKQEKDRFRSIQYPEYCLADSQHVEAINGFKGALVLEGKDGNMVLLPTRELHRDDQSFSAEVTFQEKLNPDLAWGEDQKVFLFHLDKEGTVLHNPKPEANLFLCFLLAMQRDYDRALFYMQRAQSFETYRQKAELQWAIVMIRELNDRSPQALAFYLKFALHLFHNVQQVNTTNTDGEQWWPGGKERFGFRTTFYHWLGNIFEKYIQIQPIHEDGKVPIEFRLTEQEEKFLFQTLKTYLTADDRKQMNQAFHGNASVMLDLVKINPLMSESSKNAFDVLARALSPPMNWRTIFDIRIALWDQKKWSKTIYPIMYPMFPPDAFGNSFFKTALFQSNLPALMRSERTLEDDFVRLTEEDLRRNFIQLYERMRRGDDELTLFYVIRSAGAHQESQAYALLLRYIYLNPKQFESLNFDTDLNENKKTFAQIVSIAGSFYSKIWQIASAMIEIFYRYNVDFNYYKSVSLSISPTLQMKQVPWPITPSEGLELQAIQSEVFDYFQIRWLKVSQKTWVSDPTPFPFASLEKGNPSPSLQAILSTLRKGHQLLFDKNYGPLQFQLQAGTSKEECVADAQRLLEQKHKRLVAIKEYVENLANGYPDTALRLGLKKMSRNLPHITIEGILTQAYLEKDALVIKKANPSLGPGEIHTLLFQTITYHLLKIQIHQLQHAIAALEIEHSVQKCGEALQGHGFFRPDEEPEIILFQSRSGKILRKQQGDLLTWEVKTNQKQPPSDRLFAAPAGEAGKSTLYTPIAMVREQRLGYVPFSISSKSLYKVDREGLKESLQTVFSRDLDVLEVELSSNMSSIDFQWIYEQITRPGPKAFKLTPESYCALILKYWMALYDGDVESVRWLSLIYFFPKEKGAALIDECRENGSPFTQAMVGLGRPIPLDEIDRKVCIEIYRLLLSETLQLSTHETVKECVGLHLNQQAMMMTSPTAPAAVREAVLSALVTHPYFSIPSDQQAAILAYWQDKSSEPAWMLSQATHQQARAIDLVKIYFDVVFSVAMKIVWKVHYVRSLVSREQIHVPAKDGNATRAYHAEVWITLIATIQGLIQEGLDKIQAKTLLLELKKKHLEEVGASGQHSTLEREIAQWLGVSEFHLNHYTDSDAEKLFYPLVHNNHQLILWYCEHVLLKQITFSPKQIKVTPVDLRFGFHHRTYFSADPGPEELYGFFKQTEDEANENIHSDPTFVPRALNTFMAPSNQEIISIPFFSRPFELFEALRSHDPKIYDHLEMISDAGGTVRFKTEQLVADFFEYLKKNPTVGLDGIIIFEDAAAQESATELTLQLKDWKTSKKIIGHDVPQAIQAMGLNGERLRLLTFIPISHRAGANIRGQRKGSSILVLFGEDLSLTNTAQGTLRGREVLSGWQRIIWGIPQKLTAAVGRPISAHKAVQWTVPNGAALEDRELKLAAYQWIDSCVAEPFWQEMANYKNHPQAQIALWKKHEKGHVKTTEVDLVKRFKRKKEQIPLSTEMKLWAYAEEQYNAFGYRTPWKQATSVHQQLQPMIRIAGKRLPDLSATSELDPMRKSYVYVYTQQHEVVKKEVVTQCRSDLVAEKLLELPHGMQIAHPGFISAINSFSIPAGQVWHTQYMTSNLRFTNNALHTARTSNKSLKEEYMKPLHYILILRDETQQWHAWALSDVETEYFKQQLLTFPVPQRCFALLSGDGYLCQNGQSESKFSLSELKNQFIQDVVIDVGLTRCELCFPERFKERINIWLDFWPMWERIKKAQPLPEAIHPWLIEQYVPKQIKEYIPPSSQSSSSQGLISRFLGFFG